MSERRPRNMLGLDPEIESLDDLSVALEELSWLTSREKTIDASCDQQIRLIKHDASKQKHVKVEGESVAFSARRAALEAAIEVWCEDNREVVLADSGKTRKFTHGVVGWTKQPMKIQFAEGHDQAALLKQVDEAVPTDDGGVLAYLVRQLKRIKVTEKLTAHDLLDLKLSLSKGAIKERLNNQSIDEDDLAEVGLEAVDDEKMTLKISEYFAVAEPNKAA